MRAALRLVWALDVRHLALHRTRLALSALGIAVGVALAVAVGTLSSSIEASLRSIAQATASRATIEIRANGRGGLPSDVLDRVRGVEGVRIAGATVESYTQLRSRGERVRALVIGIDSGIIRMAPRAASPSTIRTADPLGLIVPASVAETLGVEAGDRVDIATPRGWREISVGTVLPHTKDDRARVVIGTVGVLQPVLGRGTSYDAVYVEAADMTATLPRIQRAIGDSGRAGPVAFGSDQVQQLIAGATASLSVGTIVALFVGAFLVFNTMSMAAVERLREAALLRAIGARRRQVFALFLTEGGLLGLVGGSLGIVLGALLAGQLLTRQGSALESIVPVQITSLEVAPSVLVAAGVSGLIASVAAALLPARRIARADPAPNLGPSGVLEDPTRGPRRLTVTVGVLCAAAGPAITIPAVRSGISMSNLVFAGMAVTLAGIALLIPTAVPLIARVLLGGVSRLGGRLTRLASGEVLRSPGRTAFTAGAVLLSLALVVAFSIAQTSFTRAFEVGFRDVISLDLYVRSATWRIFGSDVPLDERLAEQIEDVPGVEAAWPFRLFPATYGDRSIIILTYDLDRYARYARLTGAAKRDAISQARAASERGTIIVSSSFLSQFRKSVGDTIRLPTPTGSRELRITGTADDPSAITPEIFFDYKEFKRLWRSGGADSFGVRVRSESGAARVKAAITRKLGPRYGVQVDTREQYQERLSSTVGAVTGLLGSVQLVAVIVAALGLANTLLISTLERRRDLGVLRAIGMLRRQMRRMVALEALMIGALGVLLAWGLGTVIGLGMFTFVQAQLGIKLQIVFPPSGYALAAALGLVSALVASLYPAMRAARLDVVEALQYE